MGDDDLIDVDFLYELKNRGIKLSLDEANNLKLSGNKQNVDADLIAQLKQRKADLVAWLKAQNEQAVAITPCDRSQPILASFSQQRLWLAQQLDGTSQRYHVEVGFEVNQHIHLAAVEAAVNQVVARHESLRTHFVSDEEGIKQIIRPSLPITVKHHDVSSVEEEAQSEHIEACLQAQNQVSFDLTCDPLLRVDAFSLGERWVLHFCFHHIAIDGVSIKVFLNEFKACYEAAVQGQTATLPALTLQYADYAQWQHQIAQDGTLEAQKQYWQQQMATVPSVHSLPLEGPRGGDVTQEAGKVFAQLDGATLAKLNAFAQRHQMTLFMLAHAAAALVLSRHGQTSDVVLGIPVANRKDPALEALIGFFVNNVALRTSTQQTTLVEYLAHVKQVNQQAQNNQDLPFESVLELAGLDRSSQYHPLFQIMLHMGLPPEQGLSSQQSLSSEQRLPSDKSKSLQQDSEQTLALTPFGLQADVAKFDIDINVQVHGDAMALCWTYDQGIFSALRMQNMAQHMAFVLQQFADIEAQLGSTEKESVLNNHLLNEAVLSEDALNRLPLSHIALLSEHDIDGLMQLSVNPLVQASDEQPNTVSHCIPKKRVLHEMVQAHAEQRPNHPAIVTHNGVLTYGELMAQSQRLAGYLQQQGVTKGSRVGLLLPRHGDFFVSVLAVLQLGAAYIPLDPEYPADRLSYMLDDSQPVLVIAHAHSAQQHATMLAKHTVAVLDDVEVARKIAATAVDSWDINEPVSEQDTAYIIYTSGSTGRPKGTELTHEGAAWLAHWQHQTFEISPQSRVLQFSSFSFDASVWEWLMALCGGAILHQCSTDERVDTQKLQSKLVHEAITHAMLPPSLLKFLDPNIDYSLKYITVGGEAVSQADADIWAKKCCLINGYGPTEGSVCVSYSPLVSGESVTIGGPVFGTQLYVLDEAQRLLPHGAVGELYVGGAQLAKGYLNQPELTQSRFCEVTLPKVGTQRLYRTGDLVRYNENGDLLFIGRCDSQVKIRGNRIELDEIKTQINACEGVFDSEVLVVESASGAPLLVAFAVADNDGKTSAEVEGSGNDSLSLETTKNTSSLEAAISLRLNQRLPHFMQVQHICWLSAVPQTNNGKVDTKKLISHFHETHAEKPLRQPDYPLAQSIHAIWQSQLGEKAPEFGMDDNFFSIGGHSILAVRVLSEINNQYQLELSLKDLFEHATVSALSILVAEKVAFQQATEEEFEAYFEALPEPVAHAILTRMAEQAEQDESEQAAL